MYNLDFVPALIKDNVFTIFYPFVLSGFSVVICFWAESFHLPGLQLDKPRFLTKSIFGFLAFNVVVYSMYIGQIISNNCLTSVWREQMNAVFNSCFAFLMLFVLVFFLIYGVEIFCKVKGAFKRNPGELGAHVNHGQLYQSRMGLCVQACFQITVMFLMSEVLGEMWKENMSVGDKNIVDIAFHLAELACILWFPCTLWNVKTPSRLWILNPQNLLSEQSAHEDMRIVTEAPPAVIGAGSERNNSAEEDERTHGETVGNESGKFIGASKGDSDCWICYDREREEVLIQPCNCKGDMKLVHHTCLKVWLVEKSSTGNNTGNENLACDVCKEEYRVITDAARTFWTPNKVQFRAWAQTFMVIMTMASLPVILFSVWHQIHQAVAKTALVIFLFLGEYCLLRLLGFNFVKAYNITRTRALRILGQGDMGGAKEGGSVSTVHPAEETVTSVRL